MYKFFAGLALIASLTTMTCEKETLPTQEITEGVMTNEGSKEIMGATATFLTLNCFAG